MCCEALGSGEPAGDVGDDGGAVAARVGGGERQHGGGEDQHLGVRVVMRSRLAQYDVMRLSFLLFYANLGGYLHCGVLSKVKSAWKQLCRRLLSQDTRFGFGFDK